MPYKDPEKRREASRRWYLRNRQEQIKRVMARSQKLRQEVYDYKEANPCLDCGKHYPHPVMEFDHVRGDKVANVGDLLKRNNTKKGLWGEIEKCDLVCANCHRVRTHERRKARKANQSSAERSSRA
jgi:hypothetical protein